MLSQFVNRMDDYLSNKPFKRRWWSRRWIVHMTIQPPLSKDYSLWKRSKDELRLLRLFDLSPEELGRKIERYWKKPRWRRWFASFGMNKKIDVWNYYQRCLAYQAVRPDKLKQRSLVIASESGLLLNELGLILHQSHVKFETYLEKRCRNPKWIEKHFLKEIKAHKQQLKKTFLTKLNESLKRIKTEGDRFALKQHAEQEYQQVEALMLRYYYQWLIDFLRPSLPNLVFEIGTEVAQEGNRANPECAIVVSNYSQIVPSPSQSTLPIEINHPTGIGSLDGAKEWIQIQRQCLNLLIEEGSLKKVEELLQTSLNEIKAITELYLEYCETRLCAIQGKYEAYDNFLEDLDNLQRRLKPLLQGGMILFHPDHVMNLTASQEILDIITRYSQAYLEQNRCYLGRFKNYHLRIEGFYQHSQQGLKKQQSRQDWPDLERSIQELGQSVKDLEQSFKEFAKELKEFKTQQAQHQADSEARLKESEARLKESEARLKESEAQREQDKEAMEAQREQDKEAMEAQLKESEAQRERDKVELTAKLAQYKAELDVKMKKIIDFIDLQQPASTSSASNADMPESSPVRLFKPS